MPSPAVYLFLADAVLVLHLGVVAFVVGGLLVIIAGNLRPSHALQWVNAWWFRLTHLAAIAFVVVQSWLGATCPLTTLENWLRLQGHAPIYGDGFIEHWFRRILFYEAPTWAFTLAYSVFGFVVVATWLLYPPKRVRGAQETTR